MTTLANIRTKVRRLTASPSALQLADLQIDEYVNTFYLHDLPQYLKLFDLKEKYTFFTSPNIDTYALNVNPSFAVTTTRAYYSVEPPVFIEGNMGFYTQSRSELYSYYPLSSVEDSIVGTNIAGPYAITLANYPVVRNQVTVSASDAAGNRYIAYDDGAGSFLGNVVAGSTINYLTGDIAALTFTGVIPITETITVQSVPYVASKPTTVLFYDNSFILRPIPDKTYRVEIDAYVYPTVLLNVGDTPVVQFLWQLLAIGASKKVMEDRGDTGGVEAIMPLLSEQMILCGRRTIEQNRPLRTATIYTSPMGLGNNIFYNEY